MRAIEARTPGSDTSTSLKPLRAGFAGTRSAYLTTRHGQIGASLLAVGASTSRKCVFPFPIGADIAKIGYRARSSASEPRDGLLKKDVIWSPRRGLVDFTVPHFAQYIQRNHPLAEFDE
jgi:hypothetical protein